MTGCDLACDLCGGAQSELLAEATQTRHRTVVCTECRLIYASPRPTAAELERHYDQEFLGDAGAHARTEDGGLNSRQAKIEESRVRSWAMPTLRNYLDPQGARVLDLRCQSGALADALLREGANVVPIDPFAANLDFMASTRGIDRGIQLPMSRFHELPGEEESFDAVTCLNEHVPGHVLDCRRFLARVSALLRPGGLLFLDEKHVLKPTRFKVPSLLDTGRAHIYHFVPHSLEAMLKTSGFEILKCGLDPGRKSTFRHFLAVARKPKPPARAADTQVSFSGGPSLGKIRRTVWWSEQRWAITRARYFVKHGLRRRAA